MPARSKRGLRRPVTLNEHLQDKGIRHQLFLEQYKTGEVRKLQRFLTNEVRPDMRAKMEARLERLMAGKSAPVAARRLADLDALVADITKRTGKTLNSRLAEQLIPFASQEARWQMGTVVALSPVNVTMTMPAPSALRSAALSKPFDGDILRKHWDTWSAAERRKLTGAMRQSWFQGETIRDAKARIRAILNTSDQHAESLARTAIQNTATHAREALYEENDDLIDGVQWVSTLDTTTCLECARLDGKVFPNGEERRPPAHQRCRCTTVPVVKSFRELGFDVDDLDPPQRASMNGRVSGTTTYNEWLHAQDAKTQNDALGRARGMAFRRGDLKVTAFTTRTGRTRTLGELRDREPEAFA